MRQMRLTRGCNAFPTRGRGNIFGAPAVRPGGWRRADIVAYNYYGPGKHLFLDIAVTAPDSPTALKGGSANTDGAAARARRRQRRQVHTPRHRDPLRADDYCFSTRSRTTYAAADIGLSTAMADAYMVSLLAAHDVAGRPLGGSADSQTPPHPSHHAHARAPRRENDKLAPLWYECPGLVQA